MSFLAGREVDSEAAEPLVRPNPVTGPFEGLGVWVDIYDARHGTTRSAAVETMAANGVRTLYLQSSNADRIGPFVYRDETAAFIEAAHDRGVQVVAWYLPHLTDLPVDRARTRAAITFTTPRGDRFDGFALDIESAAVRDPARRTQRLVDLSARLRAVAGDRYPLGAIVPSPVRLVDDLAVLARLPMGRPRAHLRRGAADDLLHVPRARAGRDARLRDAGRSRRSGPAWGPTRCRST